MGGLDPIWKVDWILLIMPVLVQGGISVNFKTGGPLYVAPGRTLVLEAKFKKDSEDTIDMVTWECNRGNAIVRITAGDRISLKENNSRLQIANITLVEFGTYKVTVTDSNGQQEQASIEVRKIDEPPIASVSLVLECGVNNGAMRAQWDEPQFSWYVDGDEVTNQTALLADGRRLNVSQVKGRNYTCVVNSSLGISKADYLAPKESQTCPHFHIGLIVLAFAIPIICVVGWICVKKLCIGEENRRVAVLQN